MYMCRHGSADLPMQIHLGRFANTNTPVQIHLWRNTRADDLCRYTRADTLDKFFPIIIWLQSGTDTFLCLYGCTLQCRRVSYALRKLFGWARGAKCHVCHNAIFCLFLVLQSKYFCQSAMNKWASSFTAVTDIVIIYIYIYIYIKILAWICLLPITPSISVLEVSVRWTEIAFIATKQISEAWKDCQSNFYQIGPKFLFWYQ